MRFLSFFRKLADLSLRGLPLLRKSETTGSSLRRPEIARMRCQFGVGERRKSG